jgi:hypothetical protein
MTEYIPLNFKVLYTTADCPLIKRPPNLVISWKDINVKDV